MGCTAMNLRLTPSTFAFSTRTSSISGVITKHVEIDVILNAFSPDEFDGKGKTRKTRQLTKQ